MEMVVAIAALKNRGELPEEWNNYPQWQLVLRLVQRRPDLRPSAGDVLTIVNAYSQYSSKNFNERRRNMEEIDNDEEDGSGEDYKPLPGGPASLQDEQVPISHNVYWKELSMLVYVWVAFLIVQIVKVPIAVSVTIFEAICLCKGTRVIASKGKEITNWMLHQIFLYCSCGIVAGMVGGLLGLGGGFILGPLFLELGIPPQV
ncbi:hypothetical protein ACE6H2_024599 [Prunus campanulata]